MNRVFKNINIFLAKKSIFSKKKFEKLTGIYEFLSNNYLKIFFFNETYKSRKNFGEFSYLVEKSTVAAQGIFLGGKLRPLKDYQALPAGGQVAKFPF